MSSFSVSHVWVVTQCEYTTSDTFAEGVANVIRATQELSDDKDTIYGDIQQKGGRWGDYSEFRGDRGKIHVWRIFTSS